MRIVFFLMNQKVKLPTPLAGGSWGGSGDGGGSEGRARVRKRRLASGSQLSGFCGLLLLPACADAE